MGPGCWCENSDRKFGPEILCARTTARMSQARSFPRELRCLLLLFFSFFLFFCHKLSSKTANDHHEAAMMVAEVAGASGRGLRDPNVLLGIRNSQGEMRRSSGKKQRDGTS